MSTIIEDDSKGVAFTAKNSIEENPSIKEVLRNKAFMVLFSAQFIENVGRAISGLALEFLIYELTGSPMMMGLLSIVWLLPFVVIAPFAGVYTDRLDQRKIMLGSNIMSMLASVGFVIIYLLKDVLTREYDTIFISEHGFPQQVHVISYIHVLWPLFVLCFLNSASAAFFFPARSAYTRLIVKKKNLLVANSIGSTVFQVATIVGYVIAGVLAERSYLGSFIFDASTFAVSGLLILAIFKVGKKPPEVIIEKTSFRGEVKNFVNDMKIGYRTIREFPKISYMLVVFSAMTFSLGAINVLFIVILQGEMDLGATWYGILQALMGVSGIITAVVLMAIGKIKRKVMLLNISFSLATLAMFAFSVVRNEWIMALLVSSFGLITVLINVPASTLIQESVPYEKQGRVFGTQQLVQGIAQLLGMGIVSIIAEFVVPMYVLLASSGFLLVIIVAGISYSSKRNLMSSDYIEDEKTEKPLDIFDEADLAVEKELALQIDSSSPTMTTLKEPELK